MNASNDPAAWQNFYLMIGGVNGALVGLLFVALSIHLREILDHPVLKPRAVLALVVLASQIVIAAIVLTPQTHELMGLEILVLNAIFIALNVRNRVPSMITVSTALTVAIRITYVYSAFSLILGVGGGFYVLDLVLVVTLGRTMASCWTLLTALA